MDGQGFTIEDRKKAARSNRLLDKVDARIEKAVAINVDKIIESIQKQPLNILEGNDIDVQKTALLWQHQKIEKEYHIFEGLRDRELEKKRPNEKRISSLSRILHNLLIKASPEMRKLNEGHFRMTSTKVKGEKGKDGKEKITMEQFVKMPGKNLIEKDEDENPGGE